MQARLTVSDLACRRGDRVLCRGVNLALQSGDACHVTGANGTGKTTLLRSCAGLLTPFAGTVETEGAIGLLDERMGLDPDLQLGRALAFWQKIDGCADVDAAIEVMGLDNLLDVPVRYLSTGQRKRAGLVRLIAQDAPIWLLDEPLSGLDVRAIEQVTALIARHGESGGIALVASHQTLSIAGLTTLELADYAPSTAPEPAA